MPNGARALTIRGTVLADAASAAWASGTMTLYVDGVLSATQPISGGIAEFTLSTADSLLQPDPALLQLGWRTQAAQLTV